MAVKIIKFLLAGVVAIALLSLILSFYSFLPIHIPNPRGNTDYVWPSGSYYFTTAEGMAYGKFDTNGFNNPSVIESPDVLVLGSSHMEGTNLLQSENVSTVLNDIFENRQGGGSAYKAYNEGISGHTLYKVSQYLDPSLSLYDTPPKYVVIETSSVVMTDELASSVINHTVEFTESHSTGLIAALQRVRFFRVLYSNLKNGILKRILPELYSSAPATSSSSIGVDEIDFDALDSYFEYISGIADKYGTKVIIVYHPTETLSEDGGLIFKENLESTAFAEKAAEWGIYYIDLTDAFLKEYDVNHHVPHGFETGKLCKGHLNRYGHKVFAYSVANLITAIEEADV